MKVMKSTVANMAACSVPPFGGLSPKAKQASQMNFKVGASADPKPLDSKLSPFSFRLAG